MKRLWSGNLDTRAIFWRGFLVERDYTYIEFKQFYDPSDLLDGGAECVPFLEWPSQTQQRLCA